MADHHPDDGFLDRLLTGIARRRTADPAVRLWARWLLKGDAAPRRAKVKSKRRKVRS